MRGSCVPLKLRLLLTRVFTKSPIVLWQQQWDEQRRGRGIEAASIFRHSWRERRARTYVGEPPFCSTVIASLSDTYGSNHDQICLGSHTNRR